MLRIAGAMDYNHYRPHRSPDCTASAAFATMRFESRVFEMEWRIGNEMHCDNIDSWFNLHGHGVRRAG
jgi:hypothetical protein